MYTVPIIEQIGHQTKRDAVAEVLRREILSSSLAPGTQLRQQDIAARLGVSPTPVREAFSVLEAEGYVASKPHRGVIVAERDYDDVIDAYEVRLALESVAVRRLAKGANRGALEGLRQGVQGAARAMRAGDTDAFRRASVQFHERVTAAAGSTLLRQLVDRLGAYWFFFPQDPRRMAAAHREHVAMLDALTKGDAEEAIRVLRRHMMENIETLRSIREKARPGSGPAKAESVAPPKRRAGR